MKTETLNIGDYVQITKSKINWSFKMDKFDGAVVCITEVKDNNKIRFNNDDGWEWLYSDNHFKKVSAPYSSTFLSMEEQELILLNNAISTSTYKPEENYLEVPLAATSTISIINKKYKKTTFKSDIVSF